MDFEKWQVYDSLYNNKIRTEIQGNYLKIDVYFQTLNVRQIVQEKKYTVSGGRLGSAPYLHFC